MPIFDPENPQIATQIFDVEPEAPAEAPAVYLLSSKYGLGHASRAVSLAQNLGATLPIAFAADEKVHGFIDDQLGDTDVKYSFLPISYDMSMTQDDFWGENQPALEAAETSAMVLNDFLVQVPFVREYLNQRAIGKMIAGIYHSIDGYDSISDGVKEYRDKYRLAAKALDFLFLVQPRAKYGPPYMMDDSTCVIPSGLVVRAPNKSEAEVKASIGLSEDEDFVIIQGGMLGNEEFRFVVDSLAQISIDGLKKVFLPSRMKYDDQAINLADTIVLPDRHDAHNLVAVSRGIIAKPGMQTISEAIAFRKPILLVDDPDPERKLKLAMLADILGTELPYLLDINQPFQAQVDEWREKSGEIIEQFARIDGNGASEISQILITAHRMELMAKRMLAASA